MDRPFSIFRVLGMLAWFLLIALQFASYTESEGITNEDKASSANATAFPKEALPTASGYLIVNETTGAKMFFAYYEATEPDSDQKDTPIILWLQGGPGCSSMIGNFYELGPYRISESLNIEPNPAPWNRRYGVLFIDNPVGTGFSVAPSDADIPLNQDDVAKDLYTALRSFFNLFPPFRQRPFFLAGESYAGKYVPALGFFLMGKLNKAEQQLRQRLRFKRDGEGGFRHPFRLDGLIIGNGLTHPRTQVQAHADIAYSAGLLDQQQRQKAKEWAEKVVAHIDKEEWQEAFQERTNLVNWIQNVSGIATPLDIRRTRAYHHNKDKQEYLALYLNRPEIKDVLKADPAITWVSCSPRVRKHMSNDTMKSTKHLLVDLLSRVPVLLYQGIYDIKDGAACSLEWMREIEWEGMERFWAVDRRLWEVEGEVAGYWREHDMLTHVVLHGAGHEVPADQPLYSQRMIETWITKQRAAARKIEFVSGEVFSDEEVREALSEQALSAQPVAGQEGSSPASVGVGGGGAEEEGGKGGDDYMGAVMGDLMKGFVEEMEKRGVDWSKVGPNGEGFEFDGFEPEWFETGPEKEPQDGQEEGEGEGEELGEEDGGEEDGGEEGGESGEEGEESGKVDRRGEAEDNERDL
ncbi:hypothetical protein CLOM_g9987 [Closterium sp. NIES-68]|nr:hypothetical protein CLOM_g9987 [Closterium sp. NIES-68]